MMKIYDDSIIKITSLCNNAISYPISSSWKEGDKDEIIFKNDTYLTLGGPSYEGLSGVLLTSSSSLVNKDEILVLGKDIKDIKKDSSYARICLLKVDESKLKEGNALYQAIRRIDYTRYHIYLSGVMMSISSFNKKETVRISKKAYKAGVSFSSLGASFIEAYKKHEEVECCKIIFINEDDFPYSKLNECLQKVDNITMALDHLVNKVNMDCHSCKLQVICNEVENMVKEDFSK